METELPREGISRLYQENRKEAREFMKETPDRKVRGRDGRDGFYLYKSYKPLTESGRRDSALLAYRHLTARYENGTEVRHVFERKQNGMAFYVRTREAEDGKGVGLVSVRRDMGEEKGYTMDSPALRSRHMPHRQDGFHGVSLLGCWAPGELWERAQGGRKAAERVDGWRLSDDRERLAHRRWE